MFPNWTGWKWVKAGLYLVAGTAAGVLQFANVEPALAVTIAKDALGAVAGLGSVTLLLSGTNLVPVMSRRASEKR